MNPKFILGLATIVAITIITVTGIYFFSPKNNRIQAIEPQHNEVKADPVPESALEVAASEVKSNEDIPAAEVDGIDVKELTTGSKSLSPSDHEPELLRFEFDKNLKAADTLQYMLEYEELPDFEQKNIRKYQQHVIDKISKDTGQPSTQIHVLARGALESEQAGNRYYVYKLNTGKDCEIHRLSTDLDQGDYNVSYNYC